MKVTSQSEFKRVSIISATEELMVLRMCLTSVVSGSIVS